MMQAGYVIRYSTRGTLRVIGSLGLAAPSDDDIDTLATEVEVVLKPQARGKACAVDTRPQIANELGGEYALVMGLLDDAIREHLDLKRRRGADPAEVERAEREALGPVRRGPEGPEQVGLEEPLAYDHEAEEHWEEPFDEDDEGFPMQESIHSQPFDTDEPFLDGAPPPRATAPPGHFDEFEQELPSSTQERFFDEETSTRPPSDAGAHKHHGGETVEYEVEGALEQEERGKHADDMLEETPDFLQDAPDHDRLWFEQRPPRDFDFDG